MGQGRFWRVAQGHCIEWGADWKEFVGGREIAQNWGLGPFKKKCDGGEKRAHWIECIFGGQIWWRDQIIFIWMNSNWIEFWGESKIGTPKLEEGEIFESLIESNINWQKTHIEIWGKLCKISFIHFGRLMREIWTRMREMENKINELRIGNKIERNWMCKQRN